MQLGLTLCAFTESCIPSRLYNAILSNYFQCNWIKPCWLAGWIEEKLVQNPLGKLLVEWQLHRITEGLQ
ncbi:hypothetical protein P7K49_022184 [Saguinus oedipus]|uniref:Uncharacterized protein n=1 Tax=Saguinus oedipus TaxID=9490 RepID=A0ABQ9UVI6_SAGOE|nr:hypothetical protein P7K49_022184 [Saguinus oedipus]